MNNEKLNCVNSKLNCLGLSSLSLESFIEGSKSIEFRNCCSELVFIILKQCLEVSDETKFNDSLNIFLKKSGCPYFLWFAKTKDNNKFNYNLVLLEFLISEALCFKQLQLKELIEIIKTLCKTLDLPETDFCTAIISKVQAKYIQLKASYIPPLQNVPLLSSVIEKLKSINNTFNKEYNTRRRNMLLNLDITISSMLKVKPISEDKSITEHLQQLRANLLPSAPNISEIDALWVDYETTSKFKPTNLNKEAKVKDIVLEILPFQFTREKRKKKLNKTKKRFNKFEQETDSLPQHLKDRDDILESNKVTDENENDNGDDNDDNDISDTKQRSGDDNDDTIEANLDNDDNEESIETDDFIKTKENIEESVVDSTNVQHKQKKLSKKEKRKLLKEETKTQRSITSTTDDNSIASNTENPKSNYTDKNEQKKKKRIPIFTL